LLAVDYWKVQGTRIEPKHMAKSDLVLTNSTYLRDLAKRFNPQSYFVGQGCDTMAFSSFNKKDRPNDIQCIPSPIVGYIGSLNGLRLDLEVIRHIARQKPEWNIVLVGPQDNAFKASDLQNLSNVYFLGNKNEIELPAYLSCFDVAINPQRLNEVTIGNYPRKIDEYLAMGKATVATLTKTMEYFSEHCYLASNADEYITMISRALKEDDLQKQKNRRAFACQHTWENNALAIYEKINLKESQNDHNRKNNLQPKTESNGASSFNTCQSTQASTLGKIVC
jgi:glycosyltransferase involved in cell wall biosynthesis